MRKTIALSVLLAAQMFAGGFYLQLGNPDASDEARKANAIVTVKATGCHDPATATLTATAIGSVKGARKTMPLQVTKLSGIGMFAVSGELPKEGKWVIQLVGKNDEQFTNTLITAGPNGLDRLHAKADMNPFAPSYVDSLLR
jgi:hypothetical protein